MIIISDIEKAFSVFKNIPEFSNYLSIEDVAARIGKQKYLSLIYLIDERPVAFKLGYAMNDTDFYSWLGGVEPNYRSQGIAKQLMLKQEAWVKNEGYKTLRVKSMNEFPAMMCMLISSGYQIDDVSNKESNQPLKIHFHKHLK